MSWNGGSENFWIWFCRVLIVVSFLKGFLEEPGDRE